LWVASAADLAADLSFGGRRINQQLKRNQLEQVSGFLFLVSASARVEGICLESTHEPGRTPETTN